MVISSDDGFRNYSSSEVLLKAEELQDGIFPQFCVDVGDGLVFGLRPHVENNVHTLSFHHVPFADLRRLAAGAEEFKTLDARSVGTIHLTDDERLSVAPYDSSSFAILRDNRIDVYDINSQTIRRSIPVHCPMLVSFPPPVQICDDEKKLLLQSLTGAKFELDMTTGTVQSLPCFISPRGRQFDIGDYADSASEIDFILRVNEEGKRRERWPVNDAVYVNPFAKAAYFDGVIIGDFERDIMTNRELSLYELACGSEHIQVLHMPIGKVHSLQTFALNAVIARLSRDLRMRITQRANPRSVPEMVQAVLRC